MTTTYETCPNCATDTAEWLVSDGALTKHAELAQACTECYVNEECPAGCNEPHDEPDTDDYGAGVWTCPTTDTTFYAEGDEYSPDWHTPRQWEQEPTLVHGWWYEDPYEEYSCCEDCSEWVSHDEARSDDYGTYCSDCYRGNGHGGEEADHSRYAECAQCRKNVGHDAVVYLHADTERTYCETHAAENLATIRIAA